MLKGNNVRVFRSKLGEFLEGIICSEETSASQMPQNDFHFIIFVNPTKPQTQKLPPRLPLPTNQSDAAEASVRRRSSGATFQFRGGGLPKCANDLSDGGE